MLIVLTGTSPHAPSRSRRARTLLWLAEAAMQHGFEMIVVHPNHVRITHGVPVQVSGWSYEDTAQHWISRKISILPPIEPIWVDLMYLRDLDVYRKRHRQVRRAIGIAGQRCFNSILPGKDVLYRVLASMPISPACLPQTTRLRRPADLLPLLRVGVPRWLKPIYGSGGRNVLQVTLRQDGLVRLRADSFLGHRRNAVLSPRQLIDDLQSAYRGRAFLCQEHISLPVTQADRTMDVRVTLGRITGDQWRVIATTLRRSASGGMLTNAHAGGSTCSITSEKASLWLKSAQLRDDDIQRAKRAALQVAAALGQQYRDLAFLGIDVAPTETCCSAYDFNSRPGRDILLNREIRQMMQTLVEYARSSGFRYT